MKGWYSASELAGLPGLPGSSWGVSKKAAKCSWKSQPRAGRGGGLEYHFTALPAETQRHLLKAAAPAPAVPASTVEQALAPAAESDERAHLPAVQHERVLPVPGDLCGWQRSRMVARLAILNEIERRIGVMGVERAVATLIAEAQAGELAPELQRMVPVANARSGGETGTRTLSRRTILRWRAERKLGDTALAPAQYTRPIPAWAPALLDLYQRPTKPSAASLVDLLAAMLPAGVAPPSYDAICRLLRRMPVVERERGRIGSRELKNYQPYRRRDTSELWPGDIYSMDGHTFDAEVAHPMHGRPFRPEITGCIDVATRKLVGWSVALAESGWAVLDALRHACVSHGTPSILYVDNGSGYCNALMDDLSTGQLARLSITKETSIAYNSQSRGIIERSHQTIWVRMAKELVTYIGADMDPQAKQKVFRLTRKQIRESGKSPLLLSWSDFIAKAEAAVDDYNARPHRGLPKVRDAQTGKMRHQSPNDAWADAVADGWRPSDVLPGDVDDLFRPYQTRALKRGEVTLFGNTYFNKALADYHGEAVKVGYDIHDASRVWIRDRNDQLLCIAEFEANKSSYFPVSAIEAAAAKRAEGRRRRAERVIDEIEAEHQGILGAVAQAADATEDEKAMAEEMLARLRQTQVAARDAEQAEAERVRAEADARLAVLGVDAPSSQPIALQEGVAQEAALEPPPVQRPEFSTDFEYWLWVDANPALATEQDRAYLAAALAESPALRAQVDAEKAKRARASR